MVPVHERLQRHGLRALIYSGDHDYVVPFTGTRAWLHSLGRAHMHKWQAWTMDGQVCGYQMLCSGGARDASMQPQ
jgi:serine carboxypeptidase-like clade 1